MTKKGVGQRGVAKCQKKLDEHDYNIQFDQNGEPTGDNADYYISWLGVKSKIDIPYRLQSRKVDIDDWEKLWEDTKETWNIKSDEFKSVFIKRSKKRHTTWKFILNRDFVKRGRTPFNEYKNLDEDHWNEFVAQMTNPAFLERSRKATVSANSNKNFTHLGRHSYARLTDEIVEERWSHIIQKHLGLDVIKDPRVRKILVAKAKKNKKTKVYELPDDAIASYPEMVELQNQLIDNDTPGNGKEDLVSKFFGPEHGGRTRGVSNIIGHTMVKGGSSQSGRQKRHRDAPTTQKSSEVRLDSSPCIRGSSYASGGSHVQYPPIEEVSFCELLYPQESMEEKIIGTGYVHPNTSRVLNGRQMHEDYVKVKIESVDPKYTFMPLPLVSCFNGITDIGDACGHFIQWPRKAIKFSNTESSYRDQTPPETPVSSFYKPQVMSFVFIIVHIIC